MRGATLAALGLIGTLGCGSSAEQDEPKTPAADAAAYEVCTAERLALPLIETGDVGRLTAAVTEVSPNPPAKHDNLWTLEVKDPNGIPVEDAAIGFAETYMPVHDHDGRPPPTSEPAGPGLFRVQVPFTMRGPWEVRLDLESARAGADHVVFDVCVAE